MDKFITQADHSGSYMWDEDSEELTIPSFYCKRGIELKGVDLGQYDGAKLTMSHPHQDDLAILLDSEKAQELGEWLLQSLCQPISKFPTGFLEMMRRLHEQPGRDLKIKLGDKKRFKDVIAILAKKETKNDIAD